MTPNGLSIGAIAIDVDGTLLTSRNEVTPKSRAAIDRARAAGIRVFLATARGPAGLAGVLSQVTVDGPLVSFGGALVCDLPDASGEQVSFPGFERRISESSAVSVVEIASKLGVEVAWHVGERCYAPIVGEALLREAEITGQPIEALPVAGARERPHKLLCMVGDPSRVPALDAIRDRLPRDCEAENSHRNYLEVVARGVAKSTAVARVCAELGVARHAVAAVGDAPNDIGLLRFAGTGVAMAHAPAPVRDAADWLTDTNDRDGVALALDRLLDGRSTLDMDRG